MARIRQRRSLKNNTPQLQRRPLAAIGFLAVLALVAMAVLMGPIFRSERAIPIAAAPADGTAGVSPATEVAAASLAERPVYPYSIVAGGAASVDELKKAIDSDPVVAGHYENFDLSKTRVEKLTKPKVMYVSYRMGNDIYWTRKPLVIRAGEKVLTDGENIARTRCANQLSLIPGPTSEFEPPAVTLDTPVLRPLPTPPIALVLPPGGGWRECRRSVGRVRFPRAYRFPRGPRSIRPPSGRRRPLKRRSRLRRTRHRWIAAAAAFWSHGAAFWSAAAAFWSAGAAAADDYDRRPDPAARLCGRSILQGIRTIRTIRAIRRIRRRIHQRTRRPACRNRRRQCCC